MEPSRRGGQLLAGLFPPPPLELDAAVRRALVALLVGLSTAGALVYIAVSRDAALRLPIVTAVSGSLLVAVVPWHRYPRDAFAVVGIMTSLITMWLIGVTGATNSPLIALSYVAVVVNALPLSRPIAVGLALLAALGPITPFLYADPDEVAMQRLLVHVGVLIVAAAFGPWLMAEVRRAVAVTAADRARLQSEEQRTADLERAQNVRQEYLSVLAHELRNPLNAINAAARVLARQIKATEGETTANAIAAESHHAMELLDGLTDVASLESGRMRLALRPTDLARLVTETVAGSLNGHPVSLRGAERPIEVLGDDRRLGQILRNLVSNAAKYSPEGTEVQVSLGISADRRSAIVQVRDEGPGIPPPERSRLFEKFARLSTAGSTRGSGLGLYISRGIINDHGGEIWADWPAGGGSVFSFSVPLSGEGPVQGGVR